VYEGFELLDLYGPLEMFGSLDDQIKIVTVAATKGPIASFQGPQTVAEFDYQTCPHLDLLRLTGGLGTVQQLDSLATMSFLKAKAPTSQITMSVCSGSWILAKAGLLDSRRATSNKVYFKLAVQQSNKVDWIAEARWVADGPFCQPR
jgi:putative intracellular protease/amidase